MTFEGEEGNIKKWPPVKFEGGFLNMDKKLRAEKLKMWKENLSQLEQELKAIMIKKGQAAQEGDLSENAAYTMAQEDAETTRVRIADIKKIIRDLESK